MAVVAVFYLVLSFSHFDYWIAKYNISQIENDMSYEDVSYLCNLSTDAVPALTGLYPEHNHKGGYKAEDGRYLMCPACELENHLKWIEEKIELNVRNFNLSKYQAVTH